MARWTTVPPWLYQNDLPDEDLQEVYVTAARKKVAALKADLREAGAFLRDAEEALTRYREAQAERQKALADATEARCLPKPRA